MSEAGFTATVVVDAPPETVFDFFVVPELFAAWFVVDGFTTPADRIRLDPRAGGAVAGEMVSADGHSRIPFSLRYGRIDPPRLVQFAFDDAEDAVTLAVHTLADGRTQVSYHRPYGDPEQVDGARAMLGALAASLPIAHEIAAAPRLIRPLATPPGFDAPRELAFEDVRATAITRDHLADDVAGINASLDLIRRTRGGGWPSEPVSPEGNYVDLVWHECEFRDGKSYTYVLYDHEGVYLGCAYLYPVGTRTPRTAELGDRDVDVSWWVTPDAYKRGLYDTAYRALRAWVGTSFPFSAPHFSNIELAED